MLWLIAKRAVDGGPQRLCRFAADGEADEAGRDRITPAVAALSRAVDAAEGGRGPKVGAGGDEALRLFRRAKRQADEEALSGHLPAGEVVGRVGRQAGIADERHSRVVSQARGDQARRAAHAVEAQFQRFKAAVKKPRLKRSRNGAGDLAPVPQSRDLSRIAA